MTNKTSCCLCNSITNKFFETPPVPTMDGVMSNTKTDALSCPKGAIQLSHCKNCGFISNDGYEAEKVKFDTYDFSNDHSPLFSTYVQNLCEYLIEKYDLRQKTILDVGCGDGFFLKQICALGHNKGIGIDSGFDHSNTPVEKDLDIEFIQKYYTLAHQNLEVDLVACRLVIDLLPDPVSFLKIFRANLENRPNTIVFFEVPYANYTFEEKVIWNVVYEHRSWFSKESFRYLFEMCGFEVLDTPLLWNNEFLGIEAKINPTKNFNLTKNQVALKKWNTTIKEFSESYKSLLNSVENQIIKLRRSNTKVIAWGAGARGLSLLNLFNINDLVPYIVDINEKRQGKFIPGSGQEIMAPEFIQSYQPELIIITNPTYAEEIQQQVHELGLQPEFWVL